MSNAWLAQKCTQKGASVSLEMAGLYIHIPFCRRRCNYCDFYFITNTALIDNFLAALSKELVVRANLLSGEQIETIYFGGGTPSLLAPTQIDTILNLIAKTYAVVSTVELTLEVNPEDVTEAYLHDLVRLGFNRLSLGVQSFRDSKLRWLSREHTAAQSCHALELAQAHVENVSIDLMFGIEHESLTEWEEELEMAISLQPKHLSTYSLTVEPRTLLEKLIKRGLRQPPLDAVQVQMFLLTMQRLREHGYEHYEVSNFAKPGFHSRHNRAYWNRVPYLGFGPSAHSFVITPHSEERFANQPSLKTYLEAPEYALSFREILSPKDIFNEMVLLGLRQGGGIDLSELEEKFCNFSTYFLTHLKQRTTKLESLKTEGLITIETQDAHQIIKLTDKGFTLADAIAESLFV